MNATSPYSILSLSFWRAYWVTLRPYLFFLSGVSGLVGLAIAPGLSWTEIALAFAAFFFTYGLGQALTDVFQTDTDALSSPYRPLTQGLITGRQVLAVSLTGLFGCTVVFFLFNPWTLALCALGVLGLATYTSLKRRWWGGPFWNSGVVALLPAIGLLCGEPSPQRAFSTPLLWALMASVFFSYAIFVLLGYFKDISADRPTGYDTLPVHFGWRASVWVSLGFWVAAAAASATAMWKTGILARPLDAHAVLAGLLWVAGLLVLGYAHPVMLRTTDEKEAHVSIAFVVRGYVLLHLGEAAAARPELALPALGYYALFEGALALRPERSQI
jgi:4-hydroxybenzoate polyprenyltransferase